MVRHRRSRQPIAHQWPVRVLGKDLQQIELARSHALLNGVGGVDQHAPLEIENAPGDADARALGRRPDGTPQYALDPSVNRVPPGPRCAVLCLSAVNTPSTVSSTVQRAWTTCARRNPGARYGLTAAYSGSGPTQMPTASEAVPFDHPGPPSASFGVDRAFRWSQTAACCSVPVDCVA
jgi:hypothetical protein